MKENKQYQAYQGKNQRYSSDDNKDGRERHGNRFNGAKRSHSILPPLHVLEGYERLSEGATDRLIEMAEIEQAHRHDWEDDCLRAYTKSHRIGQLFGFIVAITIVLSALYLAITGQPSVASMIAATGFLSLTVNSIVSARSRRFDRKPRKFTPRNEAKPEEAAA